MTSFRMQFENIGLGYYRKLSEVRGSVLLAEREGGNKKGSVLENAVNIQVIIINNIILFSFFLSSFFLFLSFGLFFFLFSLF